MRLLLIATKMARGVLLVGSHEGEDDTADGRPEEEWKS